MKRITLLLFFFTLFTFKASSQQQQYYYWYQHQKIPLTEDSLFLYAEFANADSANTFLRTNTDIIHKVRAVHHKTANSLVFMLKSTKELTLLRPLLPAFSFSSPAFTYHGGKILIVSRIIIKLKESYSITDLLSLYKNKLSLEDSIAHQEYLLKVRTHSFKDVLNIANEISENNSEVQWCEPDFYNSFHTTGDPLYDQQYYLHNTGQNGGTPGIDINAPEAWAVTFGSNTIRVAVIGEGVENHEDFDGRVLSGYTAGYPTGNGSPQNGNDKAHGEACAGIIAATHDNNLGIKGVDPTVQIIPVNIFPNLENPPLDPDGSATNAQVAEAINWAYSPNGGDVDVLSNSWNAGGSSNAITTAISDARTLGRGGLGCLVIFSSGNDLPFTNVRYPANLDGVITVGAIHNTGTIWDYSDRGPSMDLVAPSGGLALTGDVVTTDRMGTLGWESGNYTTRFGGTSAACPQVAGVACLMLSIDPNLTEIQVRNILQQTATDMGPNGFDNTFGYGRLNACSAVAETFSDASITGNSLLCNGSATYNISSAIDPNIVTWSTSPSGIVSLSANGDQVTVTKAGNGDITLAATIATDCGGNYSIYKLIHVGIPTPVSGIDIFPGDPLNLCPNAQYTAQVEPSVFDGYQYKWFLPDEWDQWNHENPFTTYDIQMNFETGTLTNPNGAYITVQRIDECGASEPYSIQVQVNNYNCQNISLFTVNPNPAQNSIIIRASSGEQSVKLHGTPSSGKRSMMGIRMPSYTMLPVS